MLSLALERGVQVGIYARISSDREHDQLGVRRQLVDCERIVELRGYVEVDRYVDDDVSAWSGRHRPEYERMLGDLRTGRIRGVVVWDLDRLHRHPREFEAFLDLCDEVAIEAVACVTTTVDLSEPSGRYLARSLTNMARYESDHKSERVRRKHLELAITGKPSGGGSRPFGYEHDKLRVRADEATVVKECAHRFLVGESLRSLSIDLNRRGIRTTSGGEWSPQTLRRMLASARISGQREHRGEIVANAAWPAIITPTQTTQIRALLANPERRTNKAARRYLLGGLLVCSHCGEKLVARPRAGGVRRYACAKGPGFSGCGKTYINAEQVEQFVAEAVLHRIESPEVAATVEQRPADPDLLRWYEQLEQDKAQLDELAGTYGRREISSSEWRAAREPIEQRMTATRKQLSRVQRSSALDPYRGKGGELRRDWASLDLGQQHALVAAVLDHLVVGPGRRGYNRFDESRLTPFWRP